MSHSVVWRPFLAEGRVAVGGGVVLAASYEAKAFGVCGGMPGRKARERIPMRCFIAIVHQKPSCGELRFGTGRCGIAIMSQSSR